MIPTSARKVPGDGPGEDPPAELVGHVDGDELVGGKVPGEVVDDHRDDRDALGDVDDGEPRAPLRDDGGHGCRHGSSCLLRPCLSCRAGNPAEATARRRAASAPVWSASAASGKVCERKASADGLGIARRGRGRGRDRFAELPRPTASETPLMSKGRWTSRRKACKAKATRGRTWRCALQKAAGRPKVGFQSRPRRRIDSPPGFHAHLQRPSATPFLLGFAGVGRYMA